MAESNSASLDLKRMTEHFSKSVVGNDISTKFYCDGFKELSSILDSLGRIMYFVLRDVDQKLGILNDLRDTSKHSADFCEHFTTLRKMCDFEADQYESNHLKPNAKCTLGSRNLLRLHRALLFVIDLFEKVCNDPPELTLSELAKSAYDESLANHHPWVVRKAVAVAFLALPYRHTFVATLVANQPAGGDLKDEASCRDYLVGVALPTFRRVYQLTQDIYAEVNMLNLP
ncbi:Glycolipid transfer protein domain-containing protein [Echinococcus granulosus]|uniref:Glycolipid transfer protein domain-containing protein n=2 Tax=Echinococcus granulosus TaxID=6210 RepID=W6UK35_ECHGR|nr:Glycolipid transfer protein domain-containing protein [Echinococcus granulosus]EUB61501.1 Glycolipid transfer protein domain-containing protein [Echinococcus granulosus]